MNTRPFTKNAFAPEVGSFEWMIEEARRKGYVYADGRFLLWADKALGKPVGDLFRSCLVNVRQWMLRNGLPVGKVRLDDLINYAFFSVKRAAVGLPAQDEFGRKLTVFKQKRSLSAWLSRESEKVRAPATELSFSKALKGSRLMQWIKGSEVVTDTGEPMVLYHGTGSEFSTFNNMAWGSTSPDLASGYAELRGMTGGTPMIVPIHMNIQNSFNADALAKTIRISDFFNAIAEQAPDVNDRELNALMLVVVIGARREESGPHYAPHNFWNETSSLFGADGADAIRKALTMAGFDGIKFTEEGSLTYGAFSNDQVSYAIQSAYSSVAATQEIASNDLDSLTGQAEPGYFEKSAVLNQKVEEKEHDPAEFFRKAVITMLKDQGRENAINSDGTITLYHGTTDKNAKGIEKDGKFKGHPYFTTDKGEADRYSQMTGNGKLRTLEMRVDPGSLMPSTTYLSARMEGLYRDANNVWRLPGSEGQAPQLQNDVAMKREGEGEITHFDNFTAWFGKSKVVNQTGEPLVVYHGTTKEFSEFMISEGDGNHLAGAYFSRDTARGSNYSADYYIDNDRGGYLSGGRIIPVYLAIANPASMDDLRELEAEHGGLLSGTEKTQALIKRGFDGYMDGAEIIAFFPSQIKSAIGNNQAFEFDKANPDIRFSKSTGDKSLSEWFEDSKVVDEQGLPMVVYHGTTEEFTTFKSATNAYWFTDYAGASAATYDAANSKVMAVYLKLSNPYTWKIGDPEPDEPAFRAKLIAEGYDGVIAPGNLSETDYVAFYPDQIKLANDNTVTHKLGESSKLTGRERLDSLGIRHSELLAPIDVLAARNEYPPVSSMTPAEPTQLPLGSIRVSDFGDVNDRYVDILRRVPVDSLLLSEPEDNIKKTACYQQYVAWAREGKEAPPIQVNENERGQFVSTNRRRTLAAKEAGLDTILAWVSPINPETGDPLKYGDLMTYKPDPEVSNGIDVPELAMSKKAEADISYLSPFEKLIKGKGFEAAKRAIVAQVGSVRPGERFDNDLADAIFLRLQRTAQVGRYTSMDDLEGRNPVRLAGDEQITVYRAAPKGAKLRPGDFVSTSRREAGFYTHGINTVSMFEVARKDLLAVTGSMGDDQEMVYLPEQHPHIEPQTPFASFQEFYDFINSAQLRLSQSPTNSGSLLTESALMLEAARSFPLLVPALDRIFERGRAGLQGGAIILETDNPEEMATMIAKITGYSETFYVELFHNNPGLLGIHEHRTGVAFLIGKNLSPSLGLGVLMHELIHNQQHERLDDAAQSLLDNIESQPIETQKFLRRVETAMRNSGTVGDKSEVLPYLIQQAVVENFMARSMAKEAEANVEFGPH